MEILTGDKNPILRQKSKPVEHLTKETRDLISRMKTIMQGSNGIGIAAPQINVPLRIIVCEVNNKFYAFINPETVKFSKETSSLEEGCLSLPNIYGEVERPEKITLKALGPDGKKIKLKVFGILARVIQHEIDHLDGILFIDKAAKITKEKRQITAL